VASNVPDVWEVGGAYESFIGRWSVYVAREFLSWLPVPAGRMWLDVGCGTGVLTQTILNAADPGKVTALDQAPGFVSFARQKVADKRAEFAVGSALALSAEANTFDAAVSGLVLNFLPDYAAAISEFRRVTRPGGIVAAYVWDYAGKMEILRHFWDAVVELDRNAVSLDEGRRFPICNQEELRRLFLAGGLHGVETRHIDITAHFADFQDFWSPFLLGQGPAPSYVASLGNDQRNALREAVRSRLPVSKSGTIGLVARAFAVRGTKR
jgi:SAM-dependent methyltransferase